MKRYLICKYLVLVFGLFPNNLVFSQMTDKPYEFPIRPGTEQWKRLTNSEQMDSVCIIPGTTIRQMTTEALLLTCLNYPRLIDVFLADNIQNGFSFYSKHFSGLDSLMNRRNLGTILLKSYHNLDINKKMLSNYEGALSLFQIAFLELLTSQNEILIKYTKDEKYSLLQDAINILEKRIQTNESPFEQISTTLLIMRILGSERIFIEDSITNENYKHFYRTGLLSNIDMIEKIYNKAKQVKSFH
jgi:hypothetical protein